MSSFKIKLLKALVTTNTPRSGDKKVQNSQQHFLPKIVALKGLVGYAGER